MYIQAAAGEQSKEDLGEGQKEKIRDAWIRDVCASPRKSNSRDAALLTRARPFSGNLTKVYQEHRRGPGKNARSLKFQRARTGIGKFDQTSSKH